ncbi:aldose 1-epimerase [Neobacillus mesonae]|nr:aldose 1-epimerase [Neobacillus mesonae]
MAQEQNYSAIESTYGGLHAIKLKYGAFEAVLIPEVGGNLVSFRDVERGHSYLREPGEENVEDLKANPGIYGIPVLFPPNRYEDGKFPWDGKVYQLPVNEEATGNHLHGFLHYVPWSVVSYGAAEQESYVIVEQVVREGHEYHQYLPFEYTIRLRYTLSSLGLQQQITVINEGATSMPNLLAFHTAINAPFDLSSTAADYIAKATIGHRVELNERSLPTGSTQSLTDDEVLLKTEGVNPYFASMDNHYTAEPQNGRNYMELTNTKSGTKLVYDVGASYKHWMIWNNNACGQFFCPEPQMNLVNAPNVSGRQAEDIGLVALYPGEIFEETSRLYIVNPK